MSQSLDWKMPTIEANISLVLSKESGAAKYIMDSRICHNNPGRQELSWPHFIEE